MKSDLFSLLPWFLVLLAWPLPVPAAPNFVLILADDQGWTGTSVAMHRDIVSSRSDYYQTPNLQRLANMGMRFSQGYSPAGLCCPTRRSIQFGQTPLRQGDDEAFIRRYTPDTIRHAIPLLLKQADPRYAAAHFGKWDLRCDLTPKDLGYDESDGNTRNGTGSEGDNGTPDPIAKKDKWTAFVELEDPKRIFSVTNRAIRFVERQQAAGSPFFVQISHYAVHVDMQMRSQTLEKYRALPPGRLHRNAAFAAMTEDLDAGVGMILDKLDELKLTDNTYVIYLADNGAVGWLPPDRTKHLSNRNMVSSIGRNHPLRAGKWTVFEGGVRVPFIVAGPGIPSGSFSNVPVTGWDLLPTIADLAGYFNDLPADIDGGSFRDVLENRGEGKVRRRSDALVFHRYSNSYRHSAIRVGDYKLVRFWIVPRSTGGTVYHIDRAQLFDLRHDPGETENLAGQMPKKMQELEQALLAYLRSVSSPVLDDAQHRRPALGWREHGPALASSDGSSPR